MFKLLLSLLSMTDGYDSWTMTTAMTVGRIGLNFRLPRNFPTVQKIGECDNPLLHTHTPCYLRACGDPC